jgi:hypothetical protein
MLQFHMKWFVLQLFCFNANENFNVVESTFEGEK